MMVGVVCEVGQTAKW